MAALVLALQHERHFEHVRRDARADHRAGLVEEQAHELAEPAGVVAVGGAGAKRLEDNTAEDTPGQLVEPVKTAARELLGGGDGGGREGEVAADLARRVRCPPAQVLHDDLVCFLGSSARGEGEGRGVIRRGGGAKVRGEGKGCRAAAVEGEGHGARDERRGAAAKAGR